MTLGQRLRELRHAKEFTLRELADLVGVTFTYLSKIENQRLSYGEYPSEDMIQRLAKALGADSDELLLLAQKIPNRIRQCVLSRPELFQRIANLDAKRLDDVDEFLKITSRSAKKHG